jgi:hypothetical protein
VFGCLYSCNIIYLSAPVSFLELGTGILALKKRKNKEKEKEKKNVYSRESILNSKAIDTGFFMYLLWCIF